MQVAANLCEQESAYAVVSIMELTPQQCRLTDLTSLCINCKCLNRHRQVDLSSISQLQQLRELRLEKYSSAADEGGLAYLPLSLTSLELVCPFWGLPEHEVKIALGRLVPLRRFGFCGFGFLWERIWGPLAHISGLLDLEVDCGDQIISISSFSLFIHLTRLSASCNRDELPAALGHVSNLSELQELHLFGIGEDEGYDEDPNRNHAGLLSALSRLALLTSLTLTDFWAQGVAWLSCPVMLAGLQVLGLRNCLFPALHCIAELSSATALRRLDLSVQEHRIGPHLSEITSCQQLTYLDLSLVWGIESQHMCFLSELRSLVELRMADNDTLDESVRPLLHPLGSLHALDVSGSDWLNDRGLYHINGFQGLSELKLVGCHHITVAGIVDKISRGCGPSIRVGVGEPLDRMRGYQTGFERTLRGPVSACNILRMIHFTVKRPASPDLPSTIANLIWRSFVTGCCMADTVGT